MFNILQNRNDPRYHLEDHDIETEISIDHDDDDDDDESDYGNDYNYNINNVNKVMYDDRKVTDRDGGNYNDNNDDKLQQVKKNINSSLNNNLIHNKIHDINHYHHHNLIVLHDIIINHCICNYSVDIIRELFYEMLPLYIVSSSGNYHHNYNFLESKNDMKEEVVDINCKALPLSMDTDDIHTDYIEIFEEEEEEVEEDMADDVQPRIPLDADDEYDENNHSFDHSDNEDNHKKELSTKTTIIGGDNLSNIPSNDYTVHTVDLYNKDNYEKDIIMGTNDSDNRKNNIYNNRNNYHRKSKQHKNMRSLVKGKRNKLKSSSSSKNNNNSTNNNNNSSNNNNPIVPDCNDGHNNDDYDLPIDGSRSSSSSSSTSPIPLFFRIPQLLTGIIFKERVDDMINFNGEESKYDLIQEMAVHILIDSLLLTVTVIPIVSSTIPTDCNHFICRISVSLTYITFNIQLWTVTLHAIITFALLEIPNKLFKDWLLHRKEVLYTVARMHVFGLYVFVLNIFVWPLAKYNTLYQVICTLTSLIVWVVVFLMMGTAVTDGIFDALNPTIKLKGKPHNKKIKAIIESDKNIFHSLLLREAKEVEKKKKLLLNPTLKDIDMKTFLHQLHLSHLLSIFEKEKINMELLSMLDHHDFRQLHICVADRIKIHKALHHSPSHLLHLYHHRKK